MAKSTIQFDATNQCIILTFTGYVVGDEYRQGFENLREAMIKNKVGNCLLDWTEKGISQKEDLTWLFEYWFPAVKKQIMEQRNTRVNFAIIHSKNVFADMTSQQAAKIGIQKFGFHIEYFHDFKASFEWLKSKSK